MSTTTTRTRAQMSFQQIWDGNPCAYALIVDGVKPSRPAVDSLAGDDLTPS